MHCVWTSLKWKTVEGTKTHRQWMPRSEHEVQRRPEILPHKKCVELTETESFGLLQFCWSGYFHCLVFHSLLFSLVLAHSCAPSPTWIVYSSIRHVIYASSAAIQHWWLHWCICKLNQIADFGFNLIIQHFRKQFHMQSNSICIVRRIFKLNFTLNFPNDTIILSQIDAKALFKQLPSGWPLERTAIELDWAIEYRRKKRPEEWRQIKFVHGHWNGLQDALLHFIPT